MDLFIQTFLTSNKMPTASELINLAVKKSEKTTEEKIVHLQMQVDQLRKMVEKLMPKEQGPLLITCRRCGRNGHYTLSCKATIDINGNELYFDEEYQSE